MPLDGSSVKQGDKEAQLPLVKTQAGSTNEQCPDLGGGDGHWCVRPIEPSRGVPDRHRGGGSSATVAGSPGGASGEGEGADWRRETLPDPILTHPRPEL
jgi:hypothetical protein